MTERKPTSRVTMIVAAAVLGGFLGGSLGQEHIPWTLESQMNTVIVVVVAALIAGVIAWIATRRSQS